MSGVRDAVMAGVALASAGAVPAATAPAPVWTDVARLNILCLVDGEQGVDEGVLHRRICARAQLVAARRSPVAVGIVGTGDPAILRHDAVTLLVHAWTRPRVDGRIVALTARPYRNRNDDPGTLFATPPRALVIAGDTDPALDALVDESIGGLLPWSGGPWRHDDQDDQP